jgi:hypothetical protein
MSDCDDLRIPIAWSGRVLKAAELQPIRHSLALLRGPKASELTCFGYPVGESAWKSRSFLRRDRGRR